MTLQPLLNSSTTANGIPAPLPIERCPLCTGGHSTLLHRLSDPSRRVEGVFELRRCSNCELVYVTPRPCDDALARLYDEDFYFSTGWSYAALASCVIELIQTRRRLRVERHVRPGRLLDVGSGGGRFVHHMAKHGWDATGVDFSPAALAFARRIDSGARFVQGSLADCEFPAGRLDVITMWQVLEHIAEPQPLLERCRRLLAPGGMFVAAVPNIEGLSSRLAGERWWGLDVPRHLVHYSPVTLNRALERVGFRVLATRHRSLQYDPYALLHSSLDWVFTRRHFLSDFAKRQVARDMEGGEYLYNLAALVVLAPLLAPLCVATTTAAAALGHGGFIEVHARRV